MKTTDFDYNLPQNLIAQTPLDTRDSSKLLVLNRNNDLVKDDYFYNIIDYLNEGDTLVLNNSKVMMSRLKVRKETGAKIEIFLLKQLSLNEFEALIKPVKRVKENMKLILEEGVYIKLKEIYEDGLCKVEFLVDNPLEVIEKYGEVPLPHYIKETLKEKERYQTVYSKILGSSAAPTAGLHFTKDLLEKIKEKGINITYITLHVGLGTFRPVKTDDVINHKMHYEEFEISKETSDIINKTIKNKKRIVAVGTTCVRTLESCYQKYNEIIPVKMDTNIFIYPPYKFKVVNALITNFHLPKSTLIMLVSAFYNKEKILNAYEHAIKNEYRFFSFGDAMLII